MRQPDARKEEGVALIVAIISLAFMITLGGVALNQAVSALRHTTEQGHSKRALQAADAAIEAATYAATRIDPGGTLQIDPTNPTSVVTQNCVVTVDAFGGIDIQQLNPATPANAQGNRWCPETTPEATDGGATFSYRLSQLARVNAGTCGGAGGALTLERWVVGVGRSGGEVRRVRALLKAPVSVLSGAAVQSSSAEIDLAMSGSADVVGNVISNANIIGSPAQSIDGSAIPGPGKAVNTPGPTVTGSKTQACVRFSLPNVNQADAPTNNDNGTALATTGGGIVRDCVDAISYSMVTCGMGSSATDKVRYDATQRTLSVSANGRATLAGDTFSFCSIVLEGNAVLRIPSTQPVVRIFLDDPTSPSCAGVPGAGTIRMSQSARIVNCHLDTQPQSLQIYAVGNPDLATTQILSSGGSLSATLRTAVCGMSLPGVTGEPMVVLAPHSRLELGGTIAISGQVAAEEVRLSGGSAVRSVNALANLDQLGGAPFLPLYRPVDYQECTGLDFGALPANVPEQGC